MHENGDYFEGLNMLSNEHKEVYSKMAYNAVQFDHNKRMQNAIEMKKTLSFEEGIPAPPAPPLVKDQCVFSFQLPEFPTQKKSVALMAFETNKKNAAMENLINPFL